MFFAFFCELSFSDIVPIISSSVINSGFCCIPSVILELGAVSPVSTDREYFPFEYASCPLKWLSNACMFSNIGLSVAKIKLVWCRVTACCLFSSQPRYLQYFTKSESYKLYSIVLPSSAKVKLLGPDPDTFDKDRDEI